jgi:hypothetical protein
MRIVSRKYKDYYDHLQGIDRESEPVYIRESVEMECPKIYKFLTLRAEFGEMGIYKENYSIGFCGKVYPLTILSNRTGPTSWQYCYNKESVDGFFKTNNLNWYFTNASYGTYIHGVINEKIVRKFFEDWKSKQESYQHIFETYKCPIFVVEHPIYRHKPVKLTLNAHLNRLEFFRVFDAYSAYQEIRMYLSNMAMPNRPIPSVSDKDLIEAKGFDKYSFRKDKIT